MQADFVLELLKKSKEMGLSTAIETSGYSDQRNYERILPYADEFLWDYKETDNVKHRELTGVENKKILENLRFLYQKGAVITLRCPVIPGVNDTEEHFRGIAGLIKELRNLKGWEIMPYHRMGIAKEKRLGKGESIEFSVPSKEVQEQWKQKILSYIGEDSDVNVN